MLEIIAKKTWNYARLQTPRCFQLLSPGVWVIIIAFSLVGGRLVWIHENRPKHFNEITKAYGTVSLFYGTAQINHGGNQFIYVATSDHGYGLFLHDLSTGQKQLICEEKGLGELRDDMDLRTWPWSTDDESFIYSWQNKLVIYSVESKSSEILDADANSVSEILWINPNTFAYLNNGSTLNYAAKQPNGHWKRRVSKPPKENISSLTKVAANEIAWLQDGVICHVDLNADLSDPWNSLSPDANTNLTPPTNGLSLWLDASMLKQSDQTPVTNLPDLSGQRNDAFPMGNPPIYNAPPNIRGLNGKGTIHFASNGAVDNATGLKTKLKLGLTGGAPRTILAVMHRDDGRQMLINLGDTVTQGTYFGLCAYYYGLCLPDICGVVSVIHQSSVDWNVLEATYDGTNENGYLNGVFDSSMNCPLNTSDKEVEIGKRSSNPKGVNSTASDGDFAELLVYNHALKDIEREQAEEYLSVKWFNNKLLSTQNPLVWYDPKLNGITGFIYSKEKGEFLLIRNADGRDSLWRFEPDNIDKSGRLSKIAEADSIQNVRWVDANKCAFLSVSSGNKSLILADASGPQIVTLSERESVDWFEVMPDKKQLLMGGQFNDEPSTGIGQLGLDSKQLQIVAPSSDYPSIYAKNMMPFHAPIMLSSGRMVNCTIYPPRNFNRHAHKKYPLVIGDTLFGVAINGAHGRLWIPAVASCGAYIVIIDRPGWTDGIEQWGENVMGVYQRLIKDPCIDKRRVFLFGASLETYYMNNLMTKSPGSWKGIILLNPTSLPDFSNSPQFQSRPYILISVGGEENEAGRYERYQEDAIKSGVYAKYIVHPGEGHHLVGNKAQFDRTKAILDFIFNE